MTMDLINSCKGFQWDRGNRDKNWLKHEVSNNECEQNFFNEPLLVYADSKHSVSEKRWYALGKTDLNRSLFVVFTIRESLVRIISARDMHKKEREIYYGKI